jgi:hypothetical protein
VYDGSWAYDFSIVTGTLEVIEALSTWLLVGGSARCLEKLLLYPVRPFCGSPFLTHHELFGTCWDL